MSDLITLEFAVLKALLIALLALQLLRIAFALVAKWYHKKNEQIRRELSDYDAS